MFDFNNNSFKKCIFKSQKAEKMLKAWELLATKKHQRNFSLIKVRHFVHTHEIIFVGI